MAAIIKPLWILAEYRPDPEEATMFGWFGRRPQGLDNLLSQVEDDVVRLVPAAVKAAAVPVPVYGVFLGYDDYSVGFEDMRLQVVAAADSYRQRMLLLHGRERASAFIWLPYFVPNRDAISCPLNAPDFDQKLKAVYELMVKDCTERDDPDDFLPPLRQALRRACRRLNARDWRGELTPTDDFAVVPGEYSHGTFTEEDVRESLPPARRALLESRGLLFPNPTEAERREVEQVAAELSHLPVADRIAFWLRQLAELVNGRPNQLAERGWSVKFALDRAAEFGPAAAGPLVDLAAALDRLPDREAGSPTLAAEVAMAALYRVRNLRPAAVDVERKLRDLLADSVRRNAGRQSWTETPYRCAHALNDLFEGYDGPGRSCPGCDFNNVLIDADQYLTAPLGNLPKPARTAD